MKMQSSCCLKLEKEEQLNLKKTDLYISWNIMKSGKVNTNIYSQQKA